MKNVTFSNDTGSFVFDDSIFIEDGKSSVEDFQFLALDENWKSKPVKPTEAYEVCTTVILFDRKVSSEYNGYRAKLILDPSLIKERLLKRTQKFLDKKEEKGKDSLMDQQIDCINLINVDLKNSSASNLKSTLV